MPIFFVWPQQFLRVRSPSNNAHRLSAKALFAHDKEPTYLTTYLPAYLPTYLLKTRSRALALPAEGGHF